MKDIAEAISSIIDTIIKLIDSPPAVIAFVMVAIVGMVVWKVTLYVFKYMLHHATKLGHMESIAVGYKSLYDGVPPEKALHEINEEMERRQ